ncbi:MAG: 4-hydroxybutyryl-CoA dehydratase [Deltaproteobacteria bacterium]|nr:4-hydroxybutyryl-CoA dehydratase [Deltaproteobacteria bacterium]
MALMTAEQYVESMKKIKKQVYFMGEQINITEHPLTQPALNSVALTYELCFNPEYKELFTATLESGEKVNRCVTFWKNAEDLIKKYKMIQITARLTGRGNSRTVGADAINAIGSVSYEMDEDLGTEYHPRFLKYLKYIQDNDFTISGAITDPKGDRSLRPIQQSDPDMYVRIVEKKSDGIVVRGAKVHQSVAVHAHEHIVAPCTTLREEEEDYAVVFAVPADAEGLFHVMGRQPSDTRRLEGDLFDLGGVNQGGNETLMIFDDVFVPWDRVFMCGEWKWSFPMIHRFAGYHRNCYGAGKSAIADIVIGAAALMAEYNGVARNSIIRDKLTEMVHMARTIYACGLTSCVEGYSTPSGIFNVNLMYTNVTKLHVGRLTYEIARLAEDIAGGLIATMPSHKDFTDPKIGKYVNKYLKGVDGVPTENRMKLMRLIEYFCYGQGSVYFLSESLHGAGSPQAQKLLIERESDLETKKEWAKSLAGISD